MGEMREMGEMGEVGERRKGREEKGGKEERRRGEERQDKRAYYQSNYLADLVRPAHMVRASLADRVFEKI